MASRFQRAGIEAAKHLAGLRYRKAVSDTERFSEDEFWSYQSARLQFHYRRAIAAVPYYRAGDAYPPELADCGGVLETLAQIPILPKSTVKSRRDEFDRQPRNPLAADHGTSGTTGAPLRVRAGLTERGITNAILEQRHRWATGQRYPRTVRLTGFVGDAAGEIWTRVPGTRVAYLSIYQLTSGNRSKIIRSLRNFGPQALQGYASGHIELAKLLGDSEWSTENLAVFSTSETLGLEQQDFIEQQLSATVYNDYGSQEGQHLVLQCRERGMHIHPVRGIVEILKFDSDEPAASGELGRVVVTGLVAREMPLLRYDIGDSAVSTGYATDCPCGLAWPRIGQVFGRAEELVKLRDGRRVPMLSYVTLRDAPGVAEAQIIQLDFEHFVYRIRAEDQAQRSAIEGHIRRELGARLGHGMTVTFEYVDKLERSSAGKLQAIKVAF